MKLYGFSHSSATWRVRIALALKSVDYDTETVDVLRDQHQAAPFGQVNPLRQVPVLEYADGEHKRQIGQSLAILDYLEQVFPDPRLMPADPSLRALAWQLAEIVNAGIQPLQNHGVLVKLEREGGDPVAWATHYVNKGLRAFEALVRENAGTFCIGDQVTIADLCLVPQLFNARRFGVDLTDLSSCLAIEAACNKLPAFARSIPELN